MNTLRQDLQHYLSMRRGLGFQLREAGKGLADFVGFLEERKARYITRELALFRSGPAGQCRGRKLTHSITLPPGIQSSNLAVLGRGFGSPGAERSNDGCSDRETP
jgi:hypothetical protein